MSSQVPKMLNYVILNSDAITVRRGQDFISQYYYDFYINKAKKLDTKIIFKDQLETEVTISGLANSRYHSSRTCFCSENGLCKHEIAGFFIIMDYLSRGKTFPNGTILQKKSTRKQKVKSSKIDVSKGVFIDKIIEVFKNNKISNQRPSDFNSWWEMKEIKLTSYDKNELKYSVIEPNSYRNELEEVVFYLKKKENIYARCTCRQKVNTTCAHINEVIIHLAKNDIGVLVHLDPNRKKSIMARESKLKNIPIDAIDQFFELAINSDYLTLQPKGKALGFINPQDANFDDVLNDLNDVLESPSLAIVTQEDQSNSIDEYEMGFVISNGFEEYEEKKLTNYIPVVGVRTQTAYLKYMKNYSSVNKKLIYTSKFQKSILSEIEAFYELSEDEYGSYSELENDNLIKLLYSQHKAIWSHLINEKHIFVSNRMFFLTHEEKIRKSDIVPAQLESRRLYISLTLAESDYFYSLKLDLKTEDNEISIPLHDNSDLHVFGDGIISYKTYLFLMNSLDEIFFLNQFIASGALMTIPKVDLDLFMKKIILPISKKFPVNLNNITALDINEIQLKPKAKQVYIDEQDNYVLLKPIVKYDHKIELSLGNNSIIKYDSNSVKKYERDNNFEEQFSRDVVSLHPDFTDQYSATSYFLPVHVLVSSTLFIDIVEKLKSCDIEIFGINELKKIKISPYRANISTNIKSGQDWFDIDLKVSFGDQFINLKDVRKAILRKDKFVLLSNGQQGLLPEEWIGKLEKMFRYSTISKDGLKVSKLKFSVIDEMFDNIQDAEIIQELAVKRKKLKAFESINHVKIPKEITGTLRDYQKEGYKWLNFLDEFKWGGILADDMGLGKTIQVISFLQQQVNKKKKPNLIVVPTSLLHNWENELEKFAPSLTKAFYYGPNRDIDQLDIKKLHVIITSYGTMMNDIDILMKIKFNYVILDESQAIKNPSSKRYKSACLLQCQNKLAMTGKPIENNTFDLYAQMNFLNPGFLGTANNFKEQYSKAIDSNGNVEVAQELQNMIKPFILRRTKERVAKELPPKIEDVIYCEMGSSQRKVYDAYKQKYKDLLLNKIDENGLGKSKIYILEGLTKLRQICDSPALLSDKEDYGKESVKIDTLIQHVQENTADHKILIFSQFVKMLGLIKGRLNELNISYEYLDGQCSKVKRQKSVDRFQNDDGVRVFLISLKAGGVGLNLTAADYVYIVDPWWNPAVENQAIDRCHRIGQDKHIIAYRMICTDTVEEKILKLQEKKMKIAKDIINVEESFIKKIDKSDIEQLFG